MRNGLEALKPIAISRMPSTTAFTPIASRFVIRPSTSAASARSRTPIESAPNTGRPMIPARRKMAMNAISEATDHTSVCSRLTGTPSSAARSALSALARIAMPTLLMRKNIAKPRSVSGATIIAITSFALKTTVPIVSSMSNGGARRCPRSGKSSPHARGSRIASPPRSWASPSDATVTIKPGRVEEPPDDEQLDDGSEHERRDDADGHGEQVRPRPCRHQHHDQDDRERAEVALREVDEAVRPVGQGHAERDQRSEKADDDAADEDADRHAEEDLLNDEDAQREEVGHRAVEVERDARGASRDDGRVCHAHPRRVTPAFAG